MMVLKPSRQLKSYFWKLVNSTSYAIMLFNVYDLMTPQFFCPYIKLTAHGAATPLQSYRAAQRTRVFHAVMPGDAGSGQTPRS